MTTLAQRPSDYASDDVIAQRFVAAVLIKLINHPPIDVVLGDDLSDSEIKLSNTVSIQVGTFEPYACVNVVQDELIFIGEPHNVLSVTGISSLLEEIEKFMK